MIRPRGAERLTFGVGRFDWQRRQRINTGGEVEHFGMSVPAQRQFDGPKNMKHVRNVWAAGLRSVRLCVAPMARGDG